MVAVAHGDESGDPSQRSRLARRRPHPSGERDRGMKPRRGGGRPAAPSATTLSSSAVAIRVNIVMG